MLEFGIVSVDFCLFVSQRNRQIIAGRDTREERSQAIMIGLQQRIVLVIMTLTARHCQPQKGGRRRVGQIGHHICTQAIGFRRQLKPGVLQSFSHKRVDRMQVCEFFRQWYGDGFSERPQVQSRAAKNSSHRIAFVRECIADRAAIVVGMICSCSRIGPCGTGFDPSRQDGDFPVRQFLLRRHLRIRVAKRNGFHKQTAAGISRYHSRTKLTALCCCGSAVKTQTTFLLLGTMAGDALCCEQRSDVLDKILDRLIRPRQCFSSE